MVAKGGTVGVVGVYPPGMGAFPIGLAMSKNLTVRMGNCNHRRYLPDLIDMVASGRISLAPNLTQQETLDGIVDAYKAFDRRDPGRIKVAVAIREGSGMRVSGHNTVEATTPR